MKNSRSRITSSLCSCSLLLLLLFMTTTTTSAFITVSIKPALATAASSSSALFYTDEEESEWYTPPPTPKPNKASGTDKQVPVETIVKSPEDLRSFLQDQEDKRLTIVTYHGAW